MATQASGVNRWLTLNGKPLRFDSGSDNLDAGAMEYGYNQIRLTRAAPDDLEIRIDGEPLETEIYGRWTWHPAGFAGLYEVVVSTSEHGVYQTQVRVLPKHISHQRHEWMLKEIGKFSADLLFQLQSPATERVTAMAAEQFQSPLRTYRLIESLIDELSTALAHIERMPHQALISQSERYQWHEVTEFSANVTPITGPALRLPGQQASLPTTWPEHWSVQRNMLTYDVYENRLLKQFLWRQLLPRLYKLQERAQQEIQRRRQSLSIIRRNKWVDTESEHIVELERVAATCKTMQRSVIGWGSMPFLQHVRLVTLRTIPSQVLQKHPAYSRFYKVFLRFQWELKREFNAEGFLTRIAMRKLSELYEMWSVFRLTQLSLFLLRKLDYQLVSSHGFFRVDDELFHFEVDRNAEVVLAKGNKRVVIRYEPIYPAMNDIPEGLVTARTYQSTPDMAIEVWQDGEAQHVLIFDAKYKALDEQGKRTFWQQDIQKMSAYYGDIRWKTRHRTQRPRHVVASAYILYPGETLAHNREYPEVGALPLVPGPRQQEEVLHALNDLLQNAGLI